MKAYDFSYDGKNLSDLGFTICEFDSSSGLETISNGSQITFNTLPVLHGARNELLSTSYENCLETTFQICKNQCVNESFEISAIELRRLMKWLNRKGYYKFKLFDEDYMDLYFEGSFNISKIEMGGTLYGLELNFVTNRPWALGDPKTIKISGDKKNFKATITDVSDEIGFIYPYTEIKVKEKGDLVLHNSMESRDTIIRNCVQGEIIKMDYPTIRSTMTSHQIQNDFNWTFFRICNTFHTGKNELSISLPCDITVKYSPIIKLGF